MSGAYKRKKIVWFFVIAIVALFCLRIINIDQDIAPWGVTMYQPADEGPYAYLAINEKAFGSIRPTVTEGDEEIPILISENFITNTIGNALNIVGFHIFGNNYYALRIPYVLIGLLNLLLFGLLLNRLRLVYGGDRDGALYLELALLLWMALDFTFFNASRIVEPTSVRLVFVLLAALLFISDPNDHAKRFFLLGVVITFSCFLVYITNVFLYLAVAFIMLIRLPQTKWKTFFTEIGWFAAGSLLIFIIAEAYYILVWNTEAIKNAINTVVSFSTNSSAELTIKSQFSLPHAIALIVARIISSNPFVYNLPVLFSCVLLVIPMLRQIIRRHDQNMGFLFMIVAAFIIQTFVSSDTITRKMIVIFPIVLSMLYVCFAADDSFTSMTAKGQGNADGRKWKKYIRTVLLAALWGASFLCVVFAVLYRTKLYDWTAADFDFSSKLILIILQILPLFLLTVMGIIACFGKEQSFFKSTKQRNVTIALFLGLMCLSNVAYCFKYYWRAPQFTEKKAMMDLATEVDDRYVLGGGAQLGFSLYNNLLPIVNTPEVTIATAEKLKDSVYFDYAFEGTDYLSYFTKYFYSVSDGNVYFVPRYEIKRGYKAMGEARSFCLYTPVDAIDYHDFLKGEMDDAMEELRLHDLQLQSDESSEENEEDGFDMISIQSRLYPLFPEFSTHNIHSHNPLFATVAGVIKGDTQQPIYGDILRSIYGSVNYPVYGNVYGDIVGDVNAPINGSVYGKVYGTVNAEIAGKVYNGETKDYNTETVWQKQKNKNPTWRQEGLSSNFCYSTGAIIDSEICNIVGDLNYPVYGNVENVYGDVNANIYGDVFGNIYGDLRATVYGKVYGDVYGKTVEEQ